MKKLFLTLSVLVLSALVATAGDVPIDKDKSVVPGQPLFRANEFDIGVFGAAAFGNVDYRNRESTRTTKTTQTTTQTIPVTTDVLTPQQIVTNTPADTNTGFISSTTTVLTPVPVTKNVNHTVIQTITKTAKFKYRQASHDGYGGGIEADYFFTHYLGVGIEGEWLSAGSAISAFGGSLIGRYPFERGTWAFAPYAFIGGGAQFDGVNVGYGFVGTGLEVRFSPKWGIFADGRWTANSEKINYALIRAGIRLVF